MTSSIITKIALPEFTHLNNWAEGKCGASILYVTNEQLGSAQRLLTSGRGGKLDAWMTHRRRHVGQEFCILRLGERALLRGLEIDTHELTGDCPPYFSAYACCMPLDATAEQVLAEADWEPLIKKMALQSNHRHFVDMFSDYPYTHIRLMLYPDGGLTRFRAYGHERSDAEETLHYTNAADAALGAKILACSSGTLEAASVLLQEDEQAWLTPRNRFLQGEEWVVVQLAQPTAAQAIQVDTRGLAGQAAAAYAVDGFYLPEGCDWSTQEWATAQGEELVERSPMYEEHLHHEGDLDGELLTHVRVRLYPDGGLRQLRFWGTTA